MGVKIEIFRMVLYLTFPVTMFWIANQPEYFQDEVVQRMKTIYTRDQRIQRQTRDYEQSLRKQREQKMLAQSEE